MPPLAVADPLQSPAQLSWLLTTAEALTVPIVKSWLASQPNQSITSTFQLLGMQLFCIEIPDVFPKSNNWLPFGSVQTKSNGDSPVAVAVAVLQFVTVTERLHWAHIGGLDPAKNIKKTIFFNIFRLFWVVETKFIDLLFFFAELEPARRGFLKMKKRASLFWEEEDLVLLLQRLSPRNDMTGRRRVWFFLPCRLNLFFV